MTKEKAEIFSILSHNSVAKKDIDYLCSLAVQDKDVFDELFELIFKGDGKIDWHAAWAMEKVSEKTPTLFNRQHIARLTLLAIDNRHDSLQRLCLSILVNLPVQNPISSDFINRCFAQMISPKETVGVQVLSMKFLLKIGKIVPEFESEIIVCLENTDDELYSKGYIAAKRNTLKKLKINK
ncbi:MAG: hypothetical protein ACK5KP_12260 [Paludibacteraceae bacterium]